MREPVNVFAQCVVQTKTSNHLSRLGILPISNAMQYMHDTALETTPLVMCDSNTLFYVVALF